jgi:hypothetical protein
MYTKPYPVHQNQSTQNPSAGWDAFYEPPIDVSTSSAEFFESSAGLTHPCPETTLMYAVLNDAFVSFRKQCEVRNPGVQRAGKQAEEWFFSDDCRGLFSFLSLCDVLGLDSDFIRSRLKRLSLVDPSRQQPFGAHASEIIIGRRDARTIASGR